MARVELPENALKLVQKVYTGPVNGFLRVYCVARSFAYYYGAVSSKSFTGFLCGLLFRAEKRKTNSLSRAYKVNHYLVW
jgi:hypothetical protein